MSPRTRSVDTVKVSAVVGAAKGASSTRQAIAAEMARIVNRPAPLVNPLIQRVKQPNGQISLRAVNRWLSGNSRIQTLASQRKVSRLADVAARDTISGF